MRSAEIARLLPDVFQSALLPAAGAVEPDRRMAAILGAMEVLHAPAEEILDVLDSYFHPLLAPERFVPYLAAWVDLDRRPPQAAGPDETSQSLASGVGPLRELVAAASELARLRGTARGLVRFLDTATGIPGFAVEEGVTGAGRAPRPFHLRVTGPAQAERFRPLIERVIVAEKPAYATWELVFAAAPPSPGPTGVRKREDRK